MVLNLEEDNVVGGDSWRRCPYQRRGFVKRDKPDHPGSRERSAYWRVVDAIGKPIDGKGEIETKEFRT